MASRILQTGTNQITTRYSSSHKAVDVVKYKSSLDTVIAHSAGKVVFCQTGRKNNKLAVGNASYGNCVKLDHGGYATLYAHLNSVEVKLGDTVQQGQVLGRMGNTGRSFGAHLHFEVRKDNVRIDPTPYLEEDLPLASAEAPHVVYRAYAGRWWSEITDCHDEGTDGYAGVKGKPLTALMAKAGAGTLRYRVHLRDGNRWLSWITGYDEANSRTGYAGNKGQAIDGVQMELTGASGYQVQYRVSLTDSDAWYDWYTGLESKGGGYAGVMGKAIDCIQMRIIKV